MIQAAKKPSEVSLDVEYDTVGILLIKLQYTIDGLVAVFVGRTQEYFRCFCVLCLIHRLVKKCCRFTVKQIVKKNCLSKRLRRIKLSEKVRINELQHRCMRPQPWEIDTKFFAGSTVRKFRQKFPAVAMATAAYTQVSQY